MLPTNKILHARAEDLLASLPSEIPNCHVLTDPPYGVVQKVYQHNGRDYWEDTLVDAESYWSWLSPVNDEINRILPEGGVKIIYQAFKYAHLFQQWYGDMSFWVIHKYRGNRVTPDYVVCQRKVNGQMVAAGKSDVTSKMKFLSIDRFVNGKPMPLLICKSQDELDRMLGRFTSPGELIIDPFSGNGSIALAAARNGRRFLACDHYYPNVLTGYRRLRQHVPHMFRKRMHSAG